MNDAESIQQSNPARMLIRASAVLTVIMLIAAGGLMWRSRHRQTPTVDDGGGSAAAANDNEPSYTFRVTKPNAKQSVGADRPAATVAEFALTERSGRQVTNRDLLGRPWVVSFIFTHCGGPCPRVTGQMKLLQDRFGDKPVRLVTITVDPARDTPERLANYADNFGAEPEWLFLTKDQQTIYPLIRDCFGLTVKEETGPARKLGWEITHSTRVVHVDAAGRIRGKYDALDPVEMAQLVRELEKELSGLQRKQEDSRTDVDDAGPADSRTPTDEGT